MFSMQSVAATDAEADRASAAANRTLLFALVAGLAAAVVDLLLVRSGNLFLLIVGALVLGFGPILGFALATGKVRDHLPSLFLGPIALVLGFGLLSGVFWPLVVGALSRVHAIGSLVLWSLIGQIAAILVVLFVVAPAMGQNPNWLQTGLLIHNAIWVLGISYGLSKVK